MTHTHERAIERLAALPLWRKTNASLSVEPLVGGLSNESFLVTAGGERFVARLGRDFPFHHVYREHELMVARAAFAAGFAPEVVYAEPGLMVSRFIDGKTYAGCDVAANLDRVAVLVRRFHDAMPRYVSGGARLFWAFHVIRDYARTLRAKNAPGRVSARLDEFLALAEELEAAQEPQPVVFGHHDLLPANFIDDGDRLWLIDFEYAAFGTATFDLAGIASNAGFSAEQSRHLLQAYLGAPPEPQFEQSLAAMQCASLLREAMWSMVSELHLDTPGVDYVAYTEENLQALAASLDAYRSRYANR